MAASPSQKQSASAVQTAPKTARANPTTESNTQDVFARNLLAFEAGVRDIQSEAELLAHLCNTTRNILPFRQAFALKRTVRNGPLLATATSSIAVIDRNAPLMRWIEKIINRLEQDKGIEEQAYFTLPAYCDTTDEEVSTYPFAEFLWTPLKDGDEVIAGFLTARENPWTESDITLAKRLAGLYAHSFLALKGHKRLTRPQIFTKKRSGIMAGLLAIIALLPVPMTALAPVEIAARNPFIVAAPFEGVVKDILVKQGAFVEKGAPLIAFEDTSARNEYEIADENEAVAEARFLRASQSAIYDASAKREVAVAKAEYELAKAEKAYAKDLLDKTLLRAERSGLAVYTDKRDWIGRPVAAGETIVQIADPQKLQFSIDLPVKESLVLQEEAKIRVFLDSDPLNALKGTLTEASYEPRTDKRNVLSYRLSATLDDPSERPRIGIQGTAQIQGAKAPLGYVILRRPLSAIRQFTGW